MATETLQSLKQLEGSCRSLVRHLSLLIYDNSPKRAEVASLQFKSMAVEYIHNPLNPGLAQAYQLAREKAEAAGLSWLLLLDQDTVITADFLMELVTAIPRQPTDIAAILPRLVRGGEVLSPQRIGRWHNLSMRSDMVGRSHGHVTALNAGACIRVSAFPQAGALPSRFPLDYYDHALFFILQSRGYGVYILASCLLHQLSLKQMDREMDVGRYCNVLHAERRFIQATGWGGGMPVHRVRLLKRAAVQWLTLKNKQFARATARAALAEVAPPL